ncbi:pneumococcal-type histidine triad protein [Streptococcus sp. E29BA]|uniref:pneumococcal-type histidine triad protein n=1 Tax=Streptococcus sp. E29BA TaxID=3278716 RepID=UPI00359E3DFC
MAACSQESANHRVSYVESTATSSAISQEKDSQLSPEDVAEAEGNHAEQIVVQVTDEGYVTSHGDHYHFYNGKVSFEALINKDLVLNDPAYVLKQENIVSDVADGHIIKVGDQYYLYLTQETPTHVR